MKKLLSVFLGVALIFILSSDVSAANLIVGQGQSITSVDPHFHDSGGNHSIASHFFETLIGNGPNAEAIPLLATEWKLVGDTAWEFKLRKGVKFHDGSPFTAKDVLFSFQRVIDGVPNSPGPMTGATKGVERIEIKDDHTVVFHTKGPYPLLDIDVRELWIVSEKNGKGATSDDYTRGTAMIGTGPYKFVESIPENYIKMLRNDDYWGKKEPWDAVTIRFIKSGPARVAAMLAGDVDVIDAVPSADIERLKTESRIKLWSSWTTRLNYLLTGESQDKLDPRYFRNADGSPIDSNPFRDQRVRKALSLAIDREVIKDKVFQGNVVTAKQFIPERAYGYVPGYDMSRYDPEEAKRLLAEAGYPKGFQMTLHTSNDRYINAVKVVQALAQMFTRIGLPTKVETMPHTVFSKRRSNLELPLSYAAWGVPEVHVVGIIAPLLLTYDKEKRLGRSNRGRYSNPEVDRLTLAAMYEIDAEKRKDLYLKAAKTAMDDYALIPLNFWVIDYASKPGIVFEPRYDNQIRAMSARPK